MILPEMDRQKEIKKATEMIVKNEKNCGGCHQAAVAIYIKNLLYMIQQTFCKSIAVFTGRQPGTFFIGARKIVAVRKTEFFSDIRNRQIGIRQHKIGRIDFFILNELLERNPSYL